jgi:hypothetical protein
LPNGQTNPPALQVELDIRVVAFHAPAGAAYVRIWGVGLQQIGTEFDLNGVNIKVHGGMAKGLPLANPSRANLLVSGPILQAFGNWVGLDQSIDLILSPSTGTTDAPLNIILKWRAGTTLADALAATFKTALPNAIRKISISPRLVLSHDQPGYYSTMNQLAGVIYNLSTSIITDAGYPGVMISYDGVTITATDLTTPPTPMAIAFQDLIGQPTWIEPLTIQAKLVMRGDLKVSDIVTLPPGDDCCGTDAVSGQDDVLGELLRCADTPLRK